jgi:hypothetical protein
MLQLGNRWRGEQRKRDEPAEPDDQRSQCHVPNREHPVIIIAALETAGLQEGTGVPHATGLQEPDSAMLDRITERVLAALRDALDRDERVDAATLQFVLRCYAMEPRDEVAEPLGAALAREIDRQERNGCAGDCERWTALFAEAAALSDDPRLANAAVNLLPAVRAGWSSGDVLIVDEAMRSIEACLLSVHFLEVRELAAEAVDTLERVVAGAYRPGQGMSHQTGPSTFVRGGLSDHASAASALLTAYMLTARLPYAMLADELMQSTLRMPPHEPPVGVAPAAILCDVARVYCRLAALHRDADYRKAAVLPVDQNYAADARRTLLALVPAVHDRNVEARFGLALAEWLNLR